jgi:hypothetical protein
MAVGSGQVIRGPQGESNTYDAMGNRLSEQMDSTGASSLTTVTRSTYNHLWGQTGMAVS